MYYIGVIAIHIGDNIVDWFGYTELGNTKEFSAIPKDSPTSDDFYLASCISGILFSLLMVVAYGYFIKFHVISMCGEGTEQNREDCKRWFLQYELTVRVCQLLFKDAIQSVLMFLVYLSGEADIDCASLLTKLYAFSSLFSHFKLLICFATKLFKCGSGENYGSVTKYIFCCLGCFGALTLMVFTILYLVIINSGCVSLASTDISLSYRPTSLSLYIH